VQRRHVTPAREVQQGGVKVETASSAILQVVTWQHPRAPMTPVPVEYTSSINIRDALASATRVGQVLPIGTRDYAIGSGWFCNG